MKVKKVLKYILFICMCVLMICNVIKNIQFEIKLNEIIIALDIPEKIIEFDEENKKQEEHLDDEVNEIEDQIDESILGKIFIPKINLIADIKEGTSKNIIDNYVGHFEDTSINEGNIGLAAHNRGIKVKSYFSNIKDLHENDIIVFKNEELEREYKVKMVKIIEDTDFSYLGQTEDNRITLITCVNNQPEYRLCVQAIEES